MNGSVQAIDLQGGLSDAWSSIATFVPKLILFLIILLIGVIIGKLLAKVVTFGLRKVGFDRAIDRSGLGGALARSDYDATELVGKLLYYFVLLIALQAAFAVFGSNPISDILASVVRWLPQLAVAIIIIVIVAAIARAVKDIVGAALSSLSFGGLVANLVAVFIIGLGVIAALNQIGIADFVTSSVLTAVLAALAGILIVGVGGGLVRPMQDRWSRWLARLEGESARQGDHAGTGAAPAPGAGTTGYDPGPAAGTSPTQPGI